MLGVLAPEHLESEHAIGCGLTDIAPLCNHLSFGVLLDLDRLPNNIAALNGTVDGQGDAASVRGSRSG